MADVGQIFYPEELKRLSAKERGILQKEAVRLVKKSLDIRNIIKKDPKVRKKLRAKLQPLYNKLAKK
jgi:DNA gyrase/topoisomerase IV subunit A